MSAPSDPDLIREALERSQQGDHIQPGHCDLCDLLLDARAALAEMKQRAEKLEAVRAAAGWFLNEYPGFAPSAREHARAALAAALAAASPSRSAALSSPETPEQRKEQ